MKKQIKNRQSLVSVVIPVYNGSQFLEKAVGSVLKNTYRNFEIILIDDGSTDKSKHLCRKLVKKYKRIRFYSFPRNRGLGRVLNFALQKARGEYICRINQDDEMMPTRIVKQVQYLALHPEVVLVGSWLVVEEDHQIRINKFLASDVEIRKTWLLLSPVWDSAVMYKRQAALEVGGYNQKYWPADDLHMWYRLGQVGKIANIQEPLVKIRIYPGAVSMKYHKKHMLSTYLVHRYAHNFISEAPITTQIFWFGQLAAGYILPAKFNWHIYRIIKKYIIYPLKLGYSFSTQIRNFLLNSKYSPFQFQSS